VQSGDTHLTDGPTAGLNWMYFLAPWGSQLEVVSYKELAYWKGRREQDIPWMFDRSYAGGLAKTCSLDHVGFTVPNMEEAHSFLVNVLGCTFLYEVGEYSHVNGTSNWMFEYLNVHPRSGLNIQMYRCGTGVCLEVFEYTAPDQTWQIPLPDDVGSFCLSIEVDDVDACVHRLQAHGRAFVELPIQEDAQTGVRFVNFRAPWSQRFRLVSPLGKATASEGPGGQQERVKFGVMSTANIGEKVVAAMETSQRARLAGYASRDLARLEAWANPRFGADVKLYSDLGAMLSAPELDAIYIPQPTSVRKPSVMAAAAKKKHVLCEKPVAVTLEDAWELIKACVDNGVMFMDGMMWVHHHRTDDLGRLIASGSLGQIRSASAAFCVNMDTSAENIRLDPKLEPLGCLGDIGWYACASVMFAAGAVRASATAAGRPQVVSPFRLPTRVTAHAVFSEAKLILSLNGSLIFEDDEFGPGFVASIDCSFRSAERNYLEVSGTDAMLRVDDIFFPDMVNTCGKSLQEIREDPTPNAKGRYFVRGSGEPTWATFESDPCVQERRMLETFSEIVATKAVSFNFAARSLAVQAVVMALEKAAKSGQPEVVDSKAKGYVQELLAWKSMD